MPGRSATPSDGGGGAGSDLDHAPAAWAGPSPPVPAWPDDPLPAIRRLGRDRPLLVLDDDPTGTQTLREVDVLLGWDLDAAAAMLDSPGRLAYVVTNSRAATSEDAALLARGIGTDVASIRNGRSRPSIVSRSDSTLRGHFPGEVDALADGLGIPEARLILAPYFGDGGRITVDDVHLLRVDDGFVPVAQTDFAADPTFGYRSSNLRAWVVERAGAGRPVASLSLSDLRREGPSGARDAVAGLPKGGVFIANAVIDRDVEVLVEGALEAELAGLPLIARTAATYVRARLGESRHGLLTAEDLASGGPGVIVVGSFVPAASRQLDRLRSEPVRALRAFELDAPAAARGDLGSAALSNLARGINAALRDGHDAVLWTSRQLYRQADPDTARLAGRNVANAVVQVVRRVEARPGWVIAKGGITSHDVARFGLGMRRVRVLGQVFAGVPVWRAGSESRWPGLPYVAVPGNVGDDDTLRFIASIVGSA